MQLKDIKKKKERERQTASRRALSQKYLQIYLQNNKDAVPRNSIISKYEKIRKIGQGTYGKVYMAKTKSTGRLVAMKKVLHQNKEGGLPKTSKREVEALNACRHKNVVNLLAVSIASQANRSSYLVMEFCPYDLRHILDNTRLIIGIGEKKTLMKGLLTAVKFLHGKSYIHRDIKPSNILINARGKVKLADLGLSRNSVKEEEKKYTPKVGTLWYEAPEVLLGDRNYGPPIDVWAAGCVMAELWKRKPILPGSSEIEQLKLITDLCGNINEDTWPEVKDLELFHKTELPQISTRKLESELQIDMFAFSLVEKMLCVNPNKRIDCKTSLLEDFFYSFPFPCEIDLSH